VTARRLWLALGVLLLSLVLAACGDLEDDEGGDSTAGELTTSSEETTTTTVQPAKDLPPRPSGVVEVSGETDNELLRRINGNFASFTANTGANVRLQGSQSTSEDSLEALCEGELDLAATSRRISQAELDACTANGLEVVDFQLAYDAVVVATQNEADVGADCVNLSMLRLMYGAGSPVSSWNQLNPNFSVLRIRPTGPVDNTVESEYFGSRVLGAPEPTLANFRQDYRPFRNEDEIRQYVAGRVDPRALKTFENKLRKRTVVLRKYRRNLKARSKDLRVASKELNAAGKALDQTVKDKDRKAQAEAEIRFEKAKANHKLAEKAYKDSERRFRKADKRYNDASNEVRRAGKLVPPGAVGIFSFSYYELWEDQLRPLEIDGQTGDRCVFPSDETIASELYPLSRTLRFYTTTRSLRRPEVQTYLVRILQQAAELAADFELIPVSSSVVQDQILQIRNPDAQEEADVQGGETTTESTTSTSETTSTSTSGEDTDSGEDTTSDDETSTDETTTTTTTTEGG
jgi:ABC-type phosphate transport system substrate-binding protein